jgi:hypothetical protein
LLGFLEELSGPVGHTVDFSDFATFKGKAQAEAGHPVA